MNHQNVQWIGLASTLCTVITAIIPVAAWAEVPLTRADIENLQNQVELWPQTGTARPARLSDWLDAGDAIRTARASRVDLRFNDGSLARVGERATFRFIPNTRTFRLSNGTALLLIPPGQGRSQIETPGTVTGIQGTALVVRHIPITEGTSEQNVPPEDGAAAVQGRTIVMVLTDNPEGPASVSLRDGRTVDLQAGQMAIVDQGELYVFEFDLALFYETSPLVEGLHLDDPDYSGSNLPTDPVRQETLDGLEQQQDFVGEYILNPEFLNPDTALTTSNNWLFPVIPADDAVTAAEGDTATPESTMTPSDSEASSGTSERLQPSSPMPVDSTASPTPGGASSNGSAGTVNDNLLPPGLLSPPEDQVSPGGDPNSGPPSSPPVEGGPPIDLAPGEEGPPTNITPLPETGG